MKAIIYTQYGSPQILQYTDIEKPVPKSGEVLIRVRATTVTAADCRMRKADTFMGRLFLGLTRPRRQVLGTELSGEIEAIGDDVTRFKNGDQVYGFTGMGLGAYSEYCCMPEKGSLVHKPASISHSEAAALTDGPTTAFYFLKDKANIRRGQKVLIIGASGSIGSSAVQIAKHFGADVTGVCSTSNVALVSSLGADQVIDYTQQDFLHGSERFDIVFDTVGKSSFAHCKSVLARTGSYLVTVGSLTAYLRTLLSAISGGETFIYGMSIEKSKAHTYVDRGHKRGNVVIDLDAEDIGASKDARRGSTTTLEAGERRVHAS